MIQYCYEHVDESDSDDSESDSECDENLSDDFESEDIRYERIVFHQIRLPYPALEPYNDDMDGVMNDVIDDVMDDVMDDVPESHYWTYSNICPLDPSLMTLDMKERQSKLIKRLSSVHLDVSPTSVYDQYVQVKREPVEHIVLNVLLEKDWVSQRMQRYTFLHEIQTMIRCTTKHAFNNNYILQVPTDNLKQIIIRYIRQIREEEMRNLLPIDLFCWTSNTKMLLCLKPILNEDVIGLIGQFIGVFDSEMKLVVMNRTCGFRCKQFPKDGCINQRCNTCCQVNCPYCHIVSCYM